MGDSKILHWKFTKERVYFSKTVLTANSSFKIEQVPYVTKRFIF